VVVGLAGGSVSHRVDDDCRDRRNAKVNVDQSSANNSSP
jgi:hypothetical protein